MLRAYSQILKGANGVKVGCYEFLESFGCLIDAMRDVKKDGLSMSKINSMGSEVVEGFRCKPRELDRNKPIMFSAIHLFVCEGKRCHKAASEELADRLRRLIKELGLDRGKNRIKVTRTYCNGACRFGQFAYTYKNIEAESFVPHNAFTAWKRVHTWSDTQWLELFSSLLHNTDTPSINAYRVEQQIFSPES